MAGKRGLIMGLANDKSLAWGIAKQLSQQGAELAFSYQGAAMEKRVRPLAEQLGVARLSVLRTGQHLYAQVFTADGSKVLAAANTTQTDVKEGLKNGKNADAAAKVGRIVAERAKAAGVEKVAFDRSGYRYHGRIKALAEAAREAGLQF